MSGYLKSTFVPSGDAQKIIGQSFHWFALKYLCPLFWSQKVGGYNSAAEKR
jgi:hypothetical protein